MRTLTALALPGLLGWGLAWSLDLPTLLKFGVPLALILFNSLLQPFLKARSDLVNWSPETPPLDPEVSGFVLEIFQMHGKAIPPELSALTGTSQALPVPVGTVEADHPALALANTPLGGPGLVISKGFRRLDQEAQKAALAHELYYLLSKENNALANGLLTLPTLLFTMARLVSDKKDGNFLQQYASLILYWGYRLSLGLSAWVLRGRIYKADAFAVEMTGDPVALARALLCMTFGRPGDPQAANPMGYRSPTDGSLDVASPEASFEAVQTAQDLGQTDPKGWIDALAWERENLAARFFEVFAHHPLLSRRLKILEERAQARGREYPYPAPAQGGPHFFGLFAELFTRAAPWIGGFLGYQYYQAGFLWPHLLPFAIVAGATLGFVASYGFWYRPLSRFAPGLVQDLHHDLDATESWPRPAKLEGVITGRSRVGYAFGSDLVFEDASGRLTLSYKQPIPILDQAFAYLEAESLVGKRVQVEGWFRRSPQPHLELRRIRDLESGRRFSCYPFGNQWALILALSALSYFLYYHF